MRKFYIIIFVLIIGLICSFDIFDSCKKINNIIKTQNVSLDITSKIKQVRTDK